MKAKVILRSSSFPHVELESIDEQHLEFLRRLKNTYRHCFFHQDEISPEQQRRWYAAYRARPNDWMFIIRHHNSVQGCIGYRTMDGSIDLYNFMRDEFEGPRTVFPHQAFDLLCSFAAESTGLAIRGRVLDSNPFLLWIQEHGFAIISRGVEAGLPYSLLEQDPRLRVQCSVTIESLPVAISNSAITTPV